MRIYIYVYRGYACRLYVSHGMHTYIPGNEVQMVVESLRISCVIIVAMAQVESANGLLLSE